MIATPDRTAVEIIRAEGEVDLGSAPELSARVNAVIRSTDGAVVVDLRDVTFIDSTGLAVLLNAQRRLTRARRRFGLVVAPGPVARSLALTRLDWTFEISASLEEALERAGA